MYIKQQWRILQEQPWKGYALKWSWPKLFEITAFLYYLMRIYSEFVILNCEELDLRPII
jgi:hypothetical protein